MLSTSVDKKAYIGKNLEWELVSCNSEKHFFDFIHYTQQNLSILFGIPDKFFKNYPL
jgi:hypothetical protein